jgi:hypothetical protein
VARAVWRAVFIAAALFLSLQSASNCVAEDFTSPASGVAKSQNARSEVGSATFEFGSAVRTTAKGFLYTLTALLIVVGALKQYAPKFKGRLLLADDRPIKVVSRTPVGRHALVVVEYYGRRLLFAQTENTLALVESPPGETAETSTASGAASEKLFLTSSKRGAA